MERLVFKFSKLIEILQELDENFWKFLVLSIFCSTIVVFRELVGYVMNIETDRSFVDQFETLTT